MTSSQQVRALLKSHLSGDDEHFVSVALQIAASAARSGDGKMAKELRDLADRIKAQIQSGGLPKAFPITKPSGELAGLLSVSYPQTRLSEMVLSCDTRELLENVKHEYRAADKLQHHGLSPRRKLLLVGPPGCGKTMTASVLAGELKLPLFNVQLHGLITKYMGETAAKLHLIFQAMTDTRGVYFFDEFDAIGAERGARNDVGEIRRVLNSFLQFLEQDESDGLILAATNHIMMLDDALFRRFDDVIQYLLPTESQFKQLVQNRLSRFLGKRTGWKTLWKTANGLSHAEICRACDDAAKTHVLQDTESIGTSALNSAFQHRRKKLELKAASRK
ncbi:MAG: ATP-binding protein [Planctomycetaceae bacterium]|nr:ATP-binding protein [Planctomycetales bacterium]MCB9924948.1 ATP-binding protein [Planctomycetaceae bacterium]